METQTKTKSKWKTWHKVVLIVIALFFVLTLKLISMGDAHAEAALTQWQRDSISHEDSIKTAFSGFDGSNTALVKYIKDNMNDPASFEHVETKYFDMKNKLVVIMKYRGKNAFGGVVTQQVKAEAMLNGNLIKVYNAQ